MLSNFFFTYYEKWSLLTVRTFIITLLYFLHCWEISFLFLFDIDCYLIMFTNDHNHYLIIIYLWLMILVSILLHFNSLLSNWFFNINCHLIATLYNDTGLLFDCCLIAIRLISDYYLIVVWWLYNSYIILFVNDPEYRQFYNKKQIEFQIWTFCHICKITENGW